MSAKNGSLAWVAFAPIVALAAGCASVDTTNGGSELVPVMLPPLDASEEASGDAGCTAPLLSATKEGCRADWTCASMSGGLTLACTSGIVDSGASDAMSDAAEASADAADSGAASVCGCLTGEGMLERSGPAPATACADGGAGLAAIAREFCGWDVP